MSDDSGNEDQWLYGDSANPEPPDAVDDEKGIEETSDDAIAPEVEQTPMEGIEEQAPQADPDIVLPPRIEPPVISENADPLAENGSEAVGELATEVESGEASEDTPTADGEAPTAATNGDEDDDDDDSDEDDVQVVIGDIKATTSYTSLNIKRGGLLTSTGTGDKLKQPGKFSIEEFEMVGTINGHEAIDFNVDSLEDKPWRKPGADITDYFNYGFNEETWRAYCERQKRIRVQDSGVGLATLNSSGGQPRSGLVTVPISNDNSKYSTWDQSSFLGQKKAGPPPGRRYAGSIDVIGGGGLASRRGQDKGAPAAENVIQVMTADRRDYSRKPGFPDMSMPPPGLPPPTFDLPPPGLPPHAQIPRLGPPPGPPPFVPHLDPYGNPIGGLGPSGGGEFYQPPQEDYYNYEPTQDCQWNDPVRKNWQPNSLTPLGGGGGGVRVLTSGDPPPSIVPAPKSTGAPPTAEARPEGQTASGGGSSDTTNLQLPPGVVIKEEPKDDERKDRRSKDRAEKHKDRSHRHRSRSRSAERRSRRHKSRSRSPGHRGHRKKKSRRSDRDKDESE